MELLAKRSIIEAGHRAYCPMQKHILTGHRPGNGKSVLLPLFPRYLFAEMPAVTGTPSATPVGSPK